MVRRFAKSQAFATASEDTEMEVLDAYEHVLLRGAQDVVLRDIPGMLSLLKVPKCFTNDIAECIGWLYDTEQDDQARRASAKWPVAEQLLRRLTILASVNGLLDVLDIVDIDKLTSFCARLLSFRDNYKDIRAAWQLFVTAAGHAGDVSVVLSMQDLRTVEKHLQLDDISDTILIDMLGCGKSTLDGEVLSYGFGTQLGVGIKEFAEVMGQLGELDR